MMEVNKIYIVTKESDDGTFEVGEHISLRSDGAIIGYDAHGWIPSENVDDAIKGMEVKIDDEYYARKKARLLMELNEL